MNKITSRQIAITVRKDDGTSSTPGNPSLKRIPDGYSSADIVDRFKDGNLRHLEKYRKISAL